jgi:hypothetical protein
VEHGNAVKWLCRYLAGTKDQGIIFQPNDQSFDCYVDSDFAGNWDREGASTDVDTARSRTGFVILYAGCPITWTSKLQTQVALSSTEAEVIALSTSLREATYLMQIVQELQLHGYDFTAAKPKVHCRVFEDNQGAIEIATIHKLRPRTKHINVQYHHYRQHVVEGNITVHPIDTKDQLADILTKPVAVHILHKLRKRLMGW